MVGQVGLYQVVIPEPSKQILEIILQRRRPSLNRRGIHDAPVLPAVPDRIRASGDAAAQDETARAVLEEAYRCAGE